MCAGSDVGQNMRVRNSTTTVHVTTHFAIVLSSVVQAVILAAITSTRLRTIPAVVRPSIRATRAIATPTGLLRHPNMAKSTADLTSGSFRAGTSWSSRQRSHGSRRKSVQSPWATRNFAVAFSGVELFHLRLLLLFAPTLSPRTLGGCVIDRSRTTGGSL
jgi:hypothetical protein